MLVTLSEDWIRSKAEEHSSVGDRKSPQTWLLVLFPCQQGTGIMGGAAERLLSYILCSPIYRNEDRARGEAGQ